MAIVQVDQTFNPNTLLDNKKNEITMELQLSTDSPGEYWCECDINAAAPLSLAHDVNLNIGRTRIGIIKQGKVLKKQVKLYSSSQIISGDYPVEITTYIYDCDGAIAERHDFKASIKCENQNRQVLTNG